MQSDLYNVVVKVCKLLQSIVTQPLGTLDFAITAPHEIFYLLKGLSLLPETNHACQAPNYSFNKISFIIAPKDGISHRHPLTES